jgi:hypothetical protein
MIFIPVSNFGDQPLHISGSAYFCKIFFLLSQLFKETLEEGWLSAVRFKYKPGHPHEIWKSVTNYVIEWMWLNFDVFPGSQQIPCYA